MAASNVSHLERIALDSELFTALDALAKLEGSSRQDVILHILRDWLTAINALPYHEPDEETEFDSEA
jgi:metal-responsive CopG/Arc/MetJ family transcriptional regulator